MRLLLRTILRLAAGLILALPVFAQWDRAVQLTHDNTTDNQGAKFLVDSEWHLHVFWLKSNVSSSPQRSWLYYQRFDNWGNPLCPPTNLWPDSFWLDTRPGVFMDRNEVIHVMWAREVDNPFHEWTLYARLNTEGQFLTEPYAIETHMGEAEPFMVQDTVGNVWVTAVGQIMELSENGEILQPPHEIMESPAWVLGMTPARDPEGHVWAAIDWFPPGDNHRLLSIARLDTSALVLETVQQTDGTPGATVVANGYWIDTAGVQHFVIFLDGVGLYYERFPRDGSLPDTIVIDPSPYGGGTTPLTFVNDTLEFLYGQTEPQSGTMRVGFDLAGHRLYGPELLPVRLLLTYSSAVKGRSCWLAGEGGNSGAVSRQVMMIHVPSPDEPANATRPADIVPPSSFGLSAYPNPFNPATTIRFDLLQTQRVRLDLYDVQGRLVRTMCDELREAGRQEVRFDGSDMASGVYFARLKTAQNVRTEKLLLVK
jgi:hypothetical protein